MDYQNFTSLAPHEEQAFVVYEKQMHETSKKGLRSGLIAGGVFFVLVLGLYFGFKQTHKPTEEETEALQKAKPAATDKAAAPAPAEAPGK